MEKNVYLTKDLYEASFLYAKRLRLLGLQKEGSYFWFIFEGKEKAEILSTQYWQRKGQVSPKEYADAIRSLKDMIFAKRGDENGKSLLLR